jgi:hypothetical protein
MGTDAHIQRTPWSHPGRKWEAMNPWGSVVRVYDRYGTAHVRTLGTSDPEQVDELKAFVRWLRTKRKWDALDLIIARKLSISDAFDAHEALRSQYSPGG